MKTLPNSLVNLNKLEHIDISNNPFNQFPEVIFHLPIFQYITVDKEQNKIFKTAIQKLEQKGVINHSAK